MVYLGAIDPAAVPANTYAELLKTLPTAHGLLGYEFRNARGERNTPSYTRVPGGDQLPVNEIELLDWGPRLRLAALGKN